MVRVGKSKLLSTWGFGVKQRLYTEQGDEAWILSVRDSSVDAAIAEQIILAKYRVRHPARHLERVGLVEAHDRGHPDALRPPGHRSDG